MRAAIGGIIVLALLGIGAAVLGSVLAPSGGAVVIETPASVDDVVDDGFTDAGPVPPASVLVVHVVGAVREPGIVELPLGSRVVDAIAGAGGPRDDAGLTGLNLARELVDGEQVLVPTIEEAATQAVAPPPSVGGSGLGGSGLVNLNTADAAMLDSLPGIGPAIAARILAWRDDNGPFRSVDELLAVSGIGEKTLDGFRDLVTV